MKKLSSISFLDMYFFYAYFNLSVIISMNKLILTQIDSSIVCQDFIQKHYRNHDKNFDRIVCFPSSRVETVFVASEKDFVCIDD